MEGVFAENMCSLSARARRSYIYVHVLSPAGSTIAVESLKQKAFGCLEEQHTCVQCTNIIRSYRHAETQKRQKNMQKAARRGKIHIKVPGVFKVNKIPTVKKTKYPYINLEFFEL